MRQKVLWRVYYGALSRKYIMAFLYFLKYLKTCFPMFARGIEKPLIIFTKKLHLKTSVQKSVNKFGYRLIFKKILFQTKLVQMVIDLVFMFY